MLILAWSQDEHGTVHQLGWRCNSCGQSSHILGMTAQTCLSKSRVQVYCCAFVVKTKVRFIQQNSACFDKRNAYEMTYGDIPSVGLQQELQCM